MALIKIIARFRCDGCNKTFECESIDPATKMNGASYGTLYELVMDVLANGDASASGGPSEQGNHDLCPGCTKYIDEKFPESSPTYDQVCAALNKRAGL